MNAKEFQNHIYDNAEQDYGICPPPIKAEDGLQILIDHFLGDDWYVSLPISNQQVYTEAIYRILERYPNPLKPPESVIQRLIKRISNK